MKDPNSSSFITFLCIRHDSAVLLSVFWNFLKLKMGDLLFWGEPILQSGWVICSFLLYFNYKNLKDLNCASFIRFQCILHYSAVLLSVFWIFLKLKSVDQISWEETILQNGWIIWSCFLYFSFKYLKDPHSFSFIRFQCILLDSSVLL